MPIRQSLIVCMLVIHVFATKQYFDENNDDDQYPQIKRFFFGTKPTPSVPSVIDDLIHPSSTRSPSSWTLKSTYSPLYPSSGSCMTNPCEHGGICTSTGQTTYECKCIGPWRGTYCGVADACYNSPCQNGGTCLNVYDDYWCKCTSDYYGNNCQTKFNSPSSSDNNCRANICNTGRCISLKTTYYCQCPDDRYGDHCEKRFNKRNVSNRQSFYQLLKQIKRDMNEQDDSDEYQNEGRAYYDFKNGIYF